MGVQRFFIDFDSKEPHLTVREPDLISQITKVLRMRKGDECILLDGVGNEARARLTDIEDKALTFEIVEVAKNDAESTRRVTLYCAILKKENFEWVAQKATEVGASAVIPVITKRTVKLDIKLARIQKIIREAAEQSGRGIIPVSKNPITFEQALNETRQNALTIVFDANGEEITKELFSGKESVGIFIGPEGGWEESELDALETIQARIVTLGPRTLRAETAAVVAAYLTAAN